MSKTVRIALLAIVITIAVMSVVMFYALANLFPKDAVSEPSVPQQNSVPNAASETKP